MLDWVKGDTINTRSDIHARARETQADGAVIQSVPVPQCVVEILNAFEAGERFDGDGYLRFNGSAGDALDEVEQGLEIDRMDICREVRLLVEHWQALCTHLTTGLGERRLCGAGHESVGPGSRHGERSGLVW